MDPYREVFLKWINSNKVGCLFARTLASHPDEAKWCGITRTGKSLAAEDIRTINAYLRESCGGFEAAHVLFPEIDTPGGVVALIRALCATPTWRCVEIKGDCIHSAQHLLVGLRWNLPDEKHVSWALGFGSFDPMPKTRRAPFTALVLRTGPPGRCPRIAHAHGASSTRDARCSEAPPIPVHLADMLDPFDTEEKVAGIWASTSKLKLRQLEGDPMAYAAKAKVTFCLPLQMREELATLLR